MEQDREGFKKAERYAEQILYLKKNRFLEQVPASAVRIDARSFTPNITQWYQLHGFRLNADERETGRSVNRAVSEGIRASTASGDSFAFVLMREERKVSVFYGTGRTNLEAVFRENLPECDFCRVRWIPGRYAFHGIMLGTAAAYNLSDTLASAELEDIYVSCVAIPLSDVEILSKVDENRSLLAYLNGHKSFQRIYGNASRRVEEIPVPGVVQAAAMLEEENEYLEQNMGGGFVRTAVRFGAKTGTEYKALASLIQSCTGPEQRRQAGGEPVRCFEVQGNPGSWREYLAIPCIEMDGSAYTGSVHAVSMQALPGAASFCMPPMRPHEGYFVKNYHVDENSHDIFPLTPPIEEAGVTIGDVYDSSYRAVLPFSALHSHMFISGATETGKTTTVKRILSELYKSKIPFTVIEAAKKEYLSLLGYIPELRVYTSGADGIKLAVNPLQPEEGVLIENHSAAVVRALTASLGGEHPIPEAMDGLLKQTYRQFGWEYGMMAYEDREKPYPAFKDVFDNVDSYIAAHAQYGPEVRMNLTAALKLRTETMHSGALGSLFASRRGLTACELLSTPSVIELADFSEQSAAFIMNILLFKFQSFLSRQPEFHELKRVIVVEEAHNIFRRTLSEESGRALNNSYFEKMLAEIRSSGTGMILSDQRPSIMSDAVLANTSVKIVHAMTDENDRKTIGGAINLSEFQTVGLSELNAGECIVSVRNRHGVQHVKIRALTAGDGFNAACHICTCRFRCRKAAVQKLMENIDPAKAAYHAAKIRSNPYHTAQLAGRITRMLEDLNVIAGDATKCCFLGEVMDKYGDTSFQENRIIVNTYSNYLRRGAL